MDIPDSTDWLSTPLAGLSSLENVLHCQICKEFFDTPMITSCSHTFCSRCIRTALSTDGCCPACRAQDQASKLRNNWQLQEVVATFVSARPETLKVARQQQHTIEEAAKRPGKRKRTAVEIDEEPSTRTTRSKSRRVSSQASFQDTIEIDDEEVAQEQEQADGLVECPLGCGKRMQIEEVEPHLDKCDDERRAHEKAATTSNTMLKSRPEDRLNELNYGMMKERDLAKKMKELGIPIVGSKQLMVRRHTAWVNIWNANCDSSNPRHKKDLLKDLDTWERTQGGKMPNTTSSITRKDFDAEDWSRRNQGDFSKLIANARQSKTKAAEKRRNSDGVDEQQSDNGEKTSIPTHKDETSTNTIDTNGVVRQSGSTYPDMIQPLSEQEAPSSSMSLLNDSASSIPSSDTVMQKQQPESSQHQVEIVEEPALLQNTVLPLKKPPMFVVQDT